jgi:hypothetical protein
MESFKISWYAQNERTFHRFARPHLADQHRDPLLGKLPHRPGIPIEISRGETLVSRVEERVVLLLQKDVEDLVPLLGRRIDSL